MHFLFVTALRNLIWNHNKWVMFVFFRSNKNCICHQQTWLFRYFRYFFYSNFVFIECTPENQTQFCKCDRKCFVSRPKFCALILKWKCVTSCLIVSLYGNWCWSIMVPGSDSTWGGQRECLLGVGAVWRLLSVNVWLGKKINRTRLLRKTEEQFCFLTSSRFLLSSSCMTAWRQEVLKIYIILLKKRKYLRWKTSQSWR